MKQIQIKFGQGWRDQKYPEIIDTVTYSILVIPVFMALINTIIYY